jgi:hypothetical protein
MTDAGESRLPARIWPVVGGIGVCLMAAGAVDLALGLFPFGVGEAEWEFAAVGNFLNRLPLFGVGLGLGVAAALARRRTWLALGGGGLLVFSALAVIALGALFALSVPVVLRGQADAARLGMLKAGAKGAVQAGVYGLAFLAVGLYAIRSSLRLNRPV